MPDTSPVPEEPRFGPSHDDPDLVSADTRLLCALVTRMQQDPRVRDQHICIEVQNRVVILAGVVTCPAAVTAASNHAWHTPGVHDVSNQLGCLDGPTT